MRAISVDPEYNLQVHAKTNYDNGYIDIYLTGEITEKGNTFIYQEIPVDAEYDDGLVYYIKDSDGSYHEWVAGNNNDWYIARNNSHIYIKEISIIEGESVCSGNFLITRASSLDNYFEWIEITRFTMMSDFPSEFHFFDYTVEQGIQYKYALQQYNIHDIYSRKVYQTDAEGQPTTVMADFEDMFLSDGIRQLKVRFNPKVASFKNSIPEQKIETIGSKYPFIFRNGSVNYKEFPIAGLISFQMDDAMLFLNQQELIQAGILDYKYYRIASSVDNYRHVDGYDIGNKYGSQILKIDIMNPLPNKKHIKIGERHVITEKSMLWNHNILYKDRSQNNENYHSGLVTGLRTSDKPDGIRLDRHLTSENMMGERYFKLKVLDWLTDGKVKLFRSPAEGNYLVRLLNVSMTPQDPLGRMLHSFTCTGYEVDELKYDNLVSFGIVAPAVATNYESQWSSVDVNKVTNELIGQEGPVLDDDKNVIKDENGFILISPIGVTLDGISIQDFAPGDQILLKYDSGPDGLFTVGVTGSLELNNDDRTIIEVWVKPNPAVSPYDDFARSFVYQTTNIQLTKFDAIMNINTYTQVAEQFIGPQENLLEPFDLRDQTYGIPNEDGVVLQPLDEIIAYSHVYGDLTAHKRFTYRLNKNTEKFTGLKIDILHVHKKEIIPIYCYDYQPSEDSDGDITTAKFGATPFGIPYINSTNLINFYNKKALQIDYVDEVITEDEAGHLMRTSGVNIEDITTVLDEHGVKYNLYDLLEPYYYDENDKEWKSFKSQPRNRFGYYDLYTKSWWNASIEYDPTFSINNLDEFNEQDELGINIPDYSLIGDCNISVEEINDLLLYNLGNVESIRLGSGVVAEVTAQIRVVDYEIEETDPNVKFLKETYLNKKAELNKLLDLSMLHAEELSSAEFELKTLIDRIAEVSDQIYLYNNTSVASSGVMDVALLRLIKQKQLLWYTLRNQLQDVLKILKQQQVYSHIEDSENDKIFALTDYITDDELAEEEVQNGFNNQLLDNENYLYLFTNPSEKEGDGQHSYDIISENYIFYQQKWENIKNQQQEILDQCEVALNNFQVQRGTIVGGYLSDYNDDNPPPENTLVYAEYQIAKIDKQIQEAYNHVVEVKSNLINKLLTAVLKDNTQQLTELTDSYIQDNASELIDMLDTFIALRQSELDELTNNYYNNVAKLIFKISDDQEATESQRNDVKRLLENQLLNISRNLIGTQSDNFDAATGVYKLKMFLEALLAEEQEKAVEKQNTVAVEALKFWIDYLITNKNSYTYIDPTQSQIYTALYLLDHDTTVVPQLNEDTQQLQDIQSIITDYINTLTKNNKLNLTTTEAIQNAYNNAVTSYNNLKNTVINNTARINPQNNITFGLLHAILRDYYQVPEIEKDSKGFSVFKLTVPDYNTQILSSAQTELPMINAYYAAYNIYATELTTELNELKSQQQILIGIEEDPGYIERAYSEIHSPYDNSQFINSIQAIQNNYINKTIGDNKNNLGVITQALENTGKTIYDLTELERDSTANEKISLLLKLLLDEYNKKQGTSVSNYLNKYFNTNINTSTSGTNQTVDEIITALQNADAVYELTVDALNNQKDGYVKEKNNYQAQIEDIITLMNNVEMTKKMAQSTYDNAVKEIEFGLTQTQFQESNELIERIANNAIHQSNVNLAKQYITWLDNEQEKLLSQIGQIFADVQTGKEYAEMMLAYINAYEIEAFQFLHPYTALQVDLGKGFYGNEGIDWLYFKPENYWLSSYADKLFLKENILNDDGTLKNDNLIEQLSNTNETIRLEAYQELEKHLKDILLLPETTNEKSNKITIGVVWKIQTRADGSTIELFNIVQLQQTDDPHYPNIYKLLQEITEDTPSLDYQVTGDPKDGALIPDTIFYHETDEEWRSAENDYYLDIQNKPYYTKNPKANNYYTYESTVDNKVSAFNKPFQLVSNSEFNDAVQASVQRGKPIKWMPSPPPLQIEIELHPNLFSQLSYRDNTSVTEFQFKPLEEYPFEIIPDYYNYFDKSLGLIIHDIKNDEEYGSYMALQQYDQEMWMALNVYLEAEIQHFLAARRSSDSLNEYYRLYFLIQNLSQSLDKYKKIVEDCETVLANYEAQGVSDNSGEKIQLKILLSTARDEVAYYTEQLRIARESLEALYTQNTSLRDLMSYEQTIPDSRNHLNEVLTSFYSHYDIYSKKVNHYLNLLFNNTPYGKHIDKTVLQDTNLLNINGNETDMYNFGLAYAIEAYKRNMDNEEEINFSNIIDGVDDIRDVLYKNYDFLFPLPHPVLVNKEEDEFNANYKYYTYDENKQKYQLLTTIGDTIGIRSYPTDLYVIQDPHYPGTCFIKEDNEYTQYIFIDEDHWVKDLANYDIYYTQYPSLVPFANQKAYTPINPAEEAFDISLQYYELQGDTYVPINATAENWENYSNLYTSYGNGGLMSFLNAITYKSNYISDIITAYQDTLSLYMTLLAQSLGDETLLNKLKDTLAKYELRRDELQEILKYKTDKSIDTAQLTDDIYIALANYLVGLSLTYINLVERRYGVV